MKMIKITSEFIRLDALLKLTGTVTTGGQGKILIQSGKVTVNGEICTARGKKLRSGDQVGFENESFTVT